MTSATYTGSAPMERSVSLAPSPELKPLTEILRAVGRELADLGRLTCDLQVALSPFGPGYAQNCQSPESLQLLDVLTQRLQGTADFLGALAPGLPADWMCDTDVATRLLTLSDLARRLNRPASSYPTENERAGVLEFFEAEGTS